MVAFSVDLQFLFLEASMAEVRRIFFAAHRHRTRAAGLDDEDVLQTIFMSILERQRRRGRFNPARGKLKPWLRAVVSSSVAAQLDKAERGARRGHQPGLLEDVLVTLSRQDELSEGAW